MRVKVIVPFKDSKANGKLRKPGEEFDCAAERFAEIKKAGNFVVVVEPEAKAEKQ